MTIIKKAGRLSYLFIILLGLLTVQCKKKDKSNSEVDPAFAGYISAFTSGIISNGSSIIIQLHDPLPDVKPGQKIEDKLFSFSPSIKGETFWKDNQTIEFQPTEPLPSDKLFECKFYLSKVLEVPRKLKVFEFQFQTIKQSIRLIFDGVKTYDHNDLKWQKLFGTIITADHSDELKIEELFSAIQNGKKLKISWEHAADGMNHIFVVDSVSRSESKSEVILQWNGEIIDAEEGEKIIEIPPLGDFKVLDIAVNQQPEQYITLFFSDPLKDNQELEGLIYLKSGIEVRVMVSENEVKVYPVSRLSETTSIIVETGVRNVMDYQLKERFEKSITFTNIKPAVEILGQGVILPGSNGLIFPFKAVNLSAVNVKIIKIFEDNVAQFFQVNQFDGTNELKRVGRIIYKKSVVLTSDKSIDYGKWNTFALDLSELIKVEPGAIYRVQINFDQNQSMYPCVDSGEKVPEEDTDYSGDDEISDYDNPDSYYYYDDYDYDYDDGYDWNEQNDPCKKSYYLRGRHSVSRNVFASDLGIIAKGGNSKTLLVAVSDLRTSEQLSGVEVSIYNFQNQLMAEGQTNSEGIVNIDLEGKPFLLVARKGEQVGYLRIDDGTALSLSMFDIGGQENQKGVKGFIYGERGVWRPGDSLFITFLLEDKNQVIPENHPIVFELYTPENQLYLRKVKSNTINNFYDFWTVTSPDAPTGNWLAKVKVGGSSFTKTIKIETVKPNRLKINLDFHTKVLKNKNQIPGDLEVKWLHGAVAKNLKTDVVVTLQQGNTIFEKFPDYIFDDPTKKFESEEQTIFNGVLDEEGKAKVNSLFAVKDNSPGMLQARFKIRAFEKGGDFSIDQFTIPYSAFESYVGLKVPKGPGWNGSIYSNEANLIPIVTVDENGIPVSRSKIKIQIYEVEWRWWWERSEEDDLARYIANQSSNLIKTDFISTSATGKAMYEMNLGRNTWGRKLILVTDPVSGHCAGILFYTTYKGWWNNPGQNNPGGAEMLTFSTDKDKYNVGEEVKVQLPENDKGRAFVCIESGSKVIQTFWVETKKGKNTFNFKATTEMAPNVYISITYIQPHNQMNNDLPIRLYGVQPILVEDPFTHIQPVISMPDVLAPEENVTIKVSETNGKKMTYTLAMVDEGLLDLTRFNTPDPWKNFYAREALGVKTWDMYKYVMGAFAGELSGLLAIGGDENITNKGSQKANRFKPVVKFIGPIELKASGTNTHSFKMPNYIGSVRIMVVAGGEGSYGIAEKATPVKKPLMVLATLPRVVGPSETVKLPVTVFAMDPSIKDVSIEIETNSLFKIINGNRKSLEFNREGDKVVYFDLEVSEDIGIGKVKVIVKSGKEKAEYSIELNVRLPNPRITQVISGVVESGKPWTSDYKPVGIKGTNNGMIEISSIPSLNLENRLKYLIMYPHGCIEQTTSSVFPQLHLSSLLDLSNEQKIQIEKNVMAGIERIRSFQLSSGGLSYWPGESGEANDWGTNYAGHFILEAQAKGYSIPSGFLKNWIQFQREKADEWTFESKGEYYEYNSSQLIQAYRLYTLALAGKPALGAMNRMRENTKLSVSSKWRLAAAYFLSGRIDVARQLINNLSTQVNQYKELSFSYGSSERDHAMILETLILLDDRSNGKAIFDEIAKGLASGQWYSTQTTAYSLLAVAKFIGSSGTGKGVAFTYTINNGKGIKISTTSPVSQQDMKITDINSGKVQITNNGTQPLFVKIQLDGIPLTDDQTNSENNLQMGIRYLDMDGKSFDPTIVNQGTDFMAEIVVHHPGIRSDYKEMALTQIFPSGWEIRNIRMEETASVHMVDVPRYQDIRDDRVYSYFDIRKNETKTYRVLINAAYLGKFYLPTIYCEAMYDNEINARRSGKWVEVIETGKSAISENSN